MNNDSTENGINTSVRISVIVLCLLVICAWVLVTMAKYGSTGTREYAEKTTQVITVTATESIKATPDIGTATFWIISNDTEAAVCKGINDVKSKTAIQAIKAAGAKEENIEVSSYTLTPRFDWVDGKSEPNGYEATAVLVVKDIAIADLGAIIDAAVEGGATKVQGVEYKISGKNTKYLEALNLALTTAREKADSIAAKTGLVVVETRSVTAVEGNQPRVYKEYSSLMSDGASANTTGAADVVGSPGDIELSATVEVVYNANNV